MKGNAAAHTTNAAYRAGWERTFGSRGIPVGRTLDTVTPAEWRAASEWERHEFIVRQARNGYWSFVCLTCGFPTAVGQGTCDACRP